MRVSLSALSVGLVCGGFLATNCGQPTPSCAPTNCLGCCDARTGSCVSTASIQACGRNGEVCKQCSVAEACNFGSCQPQNSGGGGGGVAGGGVSGGGSAGGLCEPSTCVGCCFQGQCRLFPENARTSSCGANGVQCAECAPGEACSQAIYTCVGSGGGSAGGVSIGGGNVAGGAAPPDGGWYRAQTVAASCEDMTTGSVTTLLSATTNPRVGDDVTTQPFSVPLPTIFFRTPMQSMSVQTNGMIQFYAVTGTASNAYQTAPIPRTALPNGFAAPLWADHYASMPLPSTAVIQMKTIAGSNYVVSWKNPMAGSATEFQAKVFVNGTIEFHYCDLDSVDAGVPTASVIGLENLSGTEGVSTSVTVAQTGLAVRYTP